MTKPKKKRKLSKDKNDPKNMNTKSLYLMALDYNNINSNDPFMSEPEPFSFSNIPDDISTDVPNKPCITLNKICSRNETDLLYSNLEKDGNNIFSTHDPSKFYTELNNVYCRKSLNRHGASVNKSIDMNIVAGYLNDIKKHNFFYQL